MARILEDLRQMDKEAVQAKIVSLKKELFELTYQARAGRIEKPHRIKLLRRDIARCETMISEMRGKK